MYIGILKREVALIKRCNKFRCRYTSFNHEQNIENEFTENV